MMRRIDEILMRLFAFFVAPLVNVVIVSVILNLCLAKNYSISALVSQLDVGGITKYISQLLTALFSGNFESLQDYLARFSGQIAAASTVAAILVILLILLVMFLLDRAIYYVGWLIPLDFAFDLKAYGAGQQADDRIRRLYGVLGRVYDFTTTYGVVTSFLGEHSADPDRIKRRGDLAKVCASSRRKFDYAVSYCCLVAAALLFAMVTTGYFRAWPLTLMLALALVIATGCLIWYANACRELVEFDIDSFIHLRLHREQTDEFLPLSETEVELAVALADASPARGFWAALCLRPEPAGILYDAYLLIRRLPALLHRGK